MKQTNVKPTGKLAAMGIISALTLLTLTSPSFGATAQGVIKPDVASKDFKLGPNDKSIMVVNEWYCLDGMIHVISPGLSSDSAVIKDMMSDINGEKTDEESKKAVREILRSQASMYLKADGKSAKDFWSAKRPKGVTLKAGGKKTWEDCYTKAELETAKTEALRWAKWVKKNIK